MEILKRLTGKEVRGISYPYGGKSALNNKVFTVARELGLLYGFTMQRGINISNNSDATALKRIDTNDTKNWAGSIK